MSSPPPKGGKKPDSGSTRHQSFEKLSGLPSIELEKRKDVLIREIDEILDQLDQALYEEFVTPEFEDWERRATKALRYRELDVETIERIIEIRAYEEQRKLQENYATTFMKLAREKLSESVFRRIDNATKRELGLPEESERTERRRELIEDLIARKIAHIPEIPDPEAEKSARNHELSTLRNLAKTAEELSQIWKEGDTIPLRMFEILAHHVEEWQFARPK